MLYSIFPSDSKRFLQNISLVVISLITMFSNQYTYGQQTVGLFLNDTGSYDGYTLITPLLTDTSYLIDNCGQKVNHWVTDYRPGFASYLLKTGNLLRTAKITSEIFAGGGSGGLIQELSWEGDLLWNFQFSDSTKQQHHDIEPMPNGNVLILSWAYRSAQQAQGFGRNPADIGNSFWPTLITEVTPIYPDSATIVWEWNAWDHLIQDFDSTLTNYGIVSDHPELIDINQSTINNVDWLHCNSVKYNPSLDQIILSSRNASELYIIDHSTTWSEASTHTGGNQNKGGDILYRWGNPINYDQGTETDRQLFYPHDAHWIPDSLLDNGKIFIFNNGGGTNGSSVDLIIPPVDINGSYTIEASGLYGPSEPIWRFEEEGFNSAHTSGAQRLPNGNTLICEGGDGNSFELNQNNNVVWKYINPAGGSGNVVQGSVPGQQVSLFRTYRYPANYPAFVGKDLTPYGEIELEPYPSDCQITPEPIDTSISNGIQHSVVQKITLNTVVDDILVINNQTGKTLNIRIQDSSGRTVDKFVSYAGVHTFVASNWTSGLYILTSEPTTLSESIFYKLFKK
jgi:hypothetical protein